MTESLNASLAAAAKRRDVTSYRPVFFDATSSDQRAKLTTLASDSSVVVVDTVEEQLDELVRSRSPRVELTKDEARAAMTGVVGRLDIAHFGSWVFYPWLSRLVHVLPEALHRELRLDRNRLKITSDEQRRLLQLTVSVAGLSVGRAVVSTLVREGIGGELRLADFDTLSLSNLNRVAGNLQDVGINKVVLAAREVVELDPYIRVTAFLDGVREETLGAFVDGADVIVDECDDLSMKVLLRERAKAASLPIVMATSDRGMLDIERFDREPERAPFHGMLAGIGSSELRGLTTKQKVPYILRILDAERLEDRMAASLVEVKETLSTWPQLASGVVLGGAMVANAVRRIALGELTGSGRFLANLDDLIASGQEASLPIARPFLPEPAAVRGPELALPTRVVSGPPTRDEMRFVTTCATLAPSGGNAQPWRFEAKGASLRAFVDPVRGSSLMDDGRASQLALGAALEAAVVGAGALGLEGSITLPSSTPGSWELHLARSTAQPQPSDGLKLLSERCSNRRTAKSTRVTDDAVRALSAAADPLDVHVVPYDRLESLGTALGAVDRVRFLSTRFRQELFSEVRWTREEATRTRDGIDAASLEMDATDLAVLEVLRTGAGMDFLVREEEGRALGNGARTAFANAGGAIVLRAKDDVSLLDAGRGLMRLWLEATRLRLAVHPWGAPLLFTRLAEAPQSFDSWERNALTAATAAFNAEVPAMSGGSTLLVLRLANAAAPSARSVRRSVDDVLVFT